MKSGSKGRAEKLEATAEIQAGRDVDGLSHSMALRAGLRGQMQKMGVQRLTRSHASFARIPFPGVGQAWGLHGAHSTDPGRSEEYVSSGEGDYADKSTCPRSTDK